jgi:Rieske Fe-S protein
MSAITPPPAFASRTVTPPPAFASRPGCATCVARRSILAMAAVAGVAGATAAMSGCQTYGAEAPAEPASPPAPAAAASRGTGEPAKAAGPALAQLADIPVGGGKVFADQKVVLTQPSAGTVKAFSAICTHAGCTVSEVSDGTINCTCHGSKFRLADGAVAEGPAGRPLPPVAIALQGTAIKLA